MRDTWLLVRKEDGRVLGYYDKLRYAKGRRTIYNKAKEYTKIVKVTTVEEVVVE